jgi:xanthine dehydrogenase YagT iron-sulfur-binding subunit
MTELPLAITINGVAHALTLDARSSLLDLLRERLHLTGAKKGCNHGACGACTVLVDGRRVLSCLTLAVTCEAAAVTTIEGLAQGEALHPLQAAFIEQDAFQCGYCTPGQILSGVACLAEGHTGSPDQIREWMSGNICRCGAYSGIIAAIAGAAESGLAASGATEPGGAQRGAALAGRAREGGRLSGGAAADHARARTAGADDARASGAERSPQ